jgi:haloalkane dehalogenase
MSHAILKPNPDETNLVMPLERPAWLAPSVWPFESSRLELDDSFVAVTDIGIGPVLLFVHAGFWSFVWRDLMTRLMRDFRCVVLDAPGTGLSGPMSERTTPLAQYARAVNRVIEAMDLQDLTLVIHDLGGPAGIAGAARTQRRVRAMAAINTFGWRPVGAIFRGMLAMMGSGAIRELDALTGFMPRIAATSFGVGRHLDAAGRRAFQAGVGPDGRRSFHAYMRDARFADELYDEVAAALSGPFRSLPVLTIFGERNDPLGFQPHWKELFPDASQVVVPRGNHFPMCDDADLVAKTLRSWHRATTADARAIPILEELH